MPAQTALEPPHFELPPRGRTTVKFKVTCATECAIVAALTVDRPTAKRLGMGKQLTIGQLIQTAPAGKTTFTLKLAAKARKALLAGSKTETYRGRLKVTAAYPDTTSASNSRQLTLKR
jgi:hypothetical protein